MSPYKNCTFKSGVHSTFKAHKSKSHREQNWQRFKSEIIGHDYISPDSDAPQKQISHVVDIEELEELSKEARNNDLPDLKKTAWAQVGISSVKDV